MFTDQYKDERYQTQETEQVDIYVNGEPFTRTKFFSVKNRMWGSDLENKTLSFDNFVLPNLVPQSSLGLPQQWAKAVKILEASTAPTSFYDYRKPQFSHTWVTGIKVGDNSYTDIPWTQVASIHARDTQGNTASLPFLMIRGTIVATPTKDINESELDYDTSEKVGEWNSGEASPEMFEYDPDPLTLFTEGGDKVMSFMVPKGLKGFKGSKKLVSSLPVSEGIHTAEPESFDWDPNSRFSLTVSLDFTSMLTPPALTSAADVV